MSDRLKQVSFQRLGLTAEDGIVDMAGLTTARIRQGDSVIYITSPSHPFSARRVFEPARRYVPYDLKLTPKDLREEISDARTHILVMSQHGGGKLGRAHLDDEPISKSYADFMQHRARNWMDNFRTLGQLVNDLERSAMNIVFVDGPTFLAKTVESVKKAISAAQTEEEKILLAQRIRNGHKRLFGNYQAGSTEQMLTRFETGLDSRHLGLSLLFANYYYANQRDEEPMIINIDQTRVPGQPDYDTTFFHPERHYHHHLKVGGDRARIWIQRNRDSKDLTDTRFADFRLEELDQQTGIYTNARLDKFHWPESLRQAALYPTLAWRVNPNGTRQLVSAAEFKEVSGELGLEFPEQRDVFAGVNWGSSFIPQDDLAMLHDGTGHIYFEKHPDRKFPLAALHVAVLLHTPRYAPTVLNKTPVIPAVEEFWARAA